MADNPGVFTPWPPAGARWLPPEHDIADLGAIQALARGEARPDQQRRALDWIIENVAAAYELSFHPESSWLTAFAEGRRYVGVNILTAIKADLSNLRTEDGRPREPTEQPSA